MRRTIVTETKNNVEKIIHRILRKQYNNRENTIIKLKYNKNRTKYNNRENIIIRGISESK